MLVTRPAIDAGGGARHVGMRRCASWMQAREAAKRDQQAKGQQAVLLAEGSVKYYPGKKTWGKAMRWLAGQKLEHLEQRLALEEMLLAVRQAADRSCGGWRSPAAVPDWSPAPLVTERSSSGLTSSPRRRCWQRLAICRGSAHRAS